jgi:RNA polymerase sigma-70 factor (ECF subfamily)
VSSVIHHVDRDLEGALVERLRNGDPAAFDDVYDAYRARIYSFLLRLSRHRDVAEDLLEETWLRLVSKAAQLRPDTQLAPWLFTVARNLYWSHCRARRLDEERRGSIGLWPTRPPEPSPFDATAGREFEGRVERAIAALPPRYREALLLVAVEGLSPADAATACAVTPEALRQRLSRARAMLARELADAERSPVPVPREAVS